MPSVNNPPVHGPPWTVPDRLHDKCRGAARPGARGRVRRAVPTPTGRADSRHSWPRICGRRGPAAFWLAADAGMAAALSPTAVLRPHPKRVSRRHPPLRHAGSWPWIICRPLAGERPQSVAMVVPPSMWVRSPASSRWLQGWSTPSSARPPGDGLPGRSGPGHDPRSRLDRAGAAPDVNRSKG
jgi:hypothetical protein